MLGAGALGGMALGAGALGSIVLGALGGMALGGMALGAWWWWRPARVEVTGDSMAPTLLPGDRLLLVRPRSVGVGDLVALTDPRQPGRLLVKRVGAIDASRVTVVGDNQEQSTDSRHFGPVPLAGLVGRACYRYHPRERAGPLPRDPFRAGASPDGRRRLAAPTPRR
ncbi:MAG: nickel-type superoxide dismutase maturation protease [Actinomycetota bacterium]|nr:nickel-type superoxide dismutase maturation protease [Actinomycetota bacterium]